MKKRTLITVGLALTMSLLVAGSAFARWGGGYGMVEKGYNYNCGDCYRSDDVNVESVTKFRKETLPLRDELLTLRLELSQEYGKDSPDADRIAQLRKGIIDIETKIQKVADKYDLDVRGRGGRGRGPADCFGGGYGRGGCN